MSNLYSSPLTYGSQNCPLRYENQPAPQVQGYDEQPVYEPQAANSPSPAPMVAAGTVLGALTGGVVGLKKNPCVIEGNNINDKFATKVYERYVKKASDSGLSNEQIKKMLGKIDKVKTAEELKTLFAENPDAATEVCSAMGKTPDEFLEKVTDKNLKSNKKMIKTKLNAAKSSKVQVVKNEILSYWNAEKKKFEKGTNPDKKLYKAIKRTSGEMKVGAVGKALGIGAAIGGVVLYAVHKLLTHKKDIQKNVY